MTGLPTTPSLPEPPLSDTAVAVGIVALLLGRPAPWSDADRAELLPYVTNVSHKP